MDRVPPVGLAGAGRRVWTRIVEAGGVPDTHLEVVLLACKQADRAAECREILTKDGLQVVDSKGQTRPHWAIEVERKASLAVASLAKIGLGVTASEATALAQEDDLYG